MNHILYDSYYKLGETGQAELRHRYKDSEIGLKLVEFLLQCTNRNYKNAEAVEFIYSDGRGEEYAVLENRYFKLRKKAINDIEELSSAKPETILTEEEAALNQCKQIIASGDKKAAYKKLTELERRCWELNIFELLPSILDNLIFLNQTLNQHDKNTELYKALEKAITLQYDINRTIMLGRQIFDIMLSKGLKFAKKQFTGLKELADKNKDYPRFALCYHHTSLYFKSSSPDYLESQQVVSRHHAEFKKLYNEHPLIPLISYKANYAKFMHFHYHQIMVFYHNNRGEYEEAYESMKEIWNMINGNDSVYAVYRSETVYFNYFTMLVITRRYRDALEVCEKYSEFVKENGHTEKLLFSNAMRGILYVNAYPQTFKMNAAFLLDQLAEYSRHSKKQGNIEFPHHHALGYITLLHVVMNNYKQAKAMLGKEEVVTYFKEMNSLDLITELIEVLAANKGTEALKGLDKKVHQRKMKEMTTDIYTTMQWFSSFIGYKLKKAN